MVDYKYERNIGDIVTFKNFLVTSKNETKAMIMCKAFKKEGQTLFKIKSKTGKLIKKVSQF